MEEEQGRAIRLNVVKKRLWYAPWKTKTLGIKFNWIFISLKNPQPCLTIFKNAHALCRRLKFSGKPCELGTTWDWISLYEEKERLNKVLLSLGGDKLPQQVMTSDYSLIDDTSEDKDLEEDDEREYPYRPILRTTTL